MAALHTQSLQLGLYERIYGGLQQSDQGSKAELLWSTKLLSFSQSDFADDGILITLIVTIHGLQKMQRIF